MLDSQYLTPYIWKNRLLALILQTENINDTNNNTNYERY